MAYSIYRYHLLDIKLAVTRAGIFVGVYTLVLAAPFLVGYLLRGRHWFIPTGIAVLCASLGPYIYSFLQKQAELRLRREEFRQHQALRSLSQNMLRFTKLDTLLKLIVHNLVKVLRLEYSAIYLKQEQNQNFKLYSIWAVEETVSLPEGFDAGSDLVRTLNLKKAPFIFEKEKRSHQSPLISSASCVIPIFVHSQLMGFIILGEKRSKAILTLDDINILTLLANQASLSIENARFYQQQQAKQIEESREQLAKDIAYGVSHQFNNRLYIMGLTAEPLYLAYKDKDPASLSKEQQSQFFSKTLEVFSNIIQQVKEGSQIAQGIMGFATISNKGSFEKVDLVSSIARSLHAAKLKHLKTTIEGLINFPVIVNNLSKNLPFILANPSQIQDIFFVLFDNSFDVLEDCSVSRGRSFQGRINVDATNSNDSIRVLIEDNGSGIRPEHMKRLFLPYFTTKKATDVKGRGLGLSIIKQFVLANKGKIWAESEFGSWTRFSVEFPIAK